MKYKCLLIFFSLLIKLSYEEPLQIDVIPLTGLVNSKYDSKWHIFTFDILCKVNKNITHSIGKIKIKIKLKKYPDNGEGLIISYCNIIPVRVAQNSMSETCLKCSINTNAYPFVKQDTILIYSDYIEQETSDKAVFSFNNFEHISSLINVNIESVNNINNGLCLNDKYIFEINTQDDFKNNPLLESTICRVELSDDEFHNLARCAIPMEGKKMKCYIDIEEKKYKKGDNIVIEQQDIVPCDNGQAIKLLTDPKKTLSIVEECGAKIFTNNINKLFFSLLFIFIIL